MKQRHVDLRGTGATTASHPARVQHETGDSQSATAPATSVDLPSTLDLVPSRNPTDARVFAHHRILRLRAWPEMRYLAPQDVADHSRICALLAVRPSVAYLVHRRLGLPAERVMTALRDLHDRGFLEVVADGFDRDAWRPSDFDEDAALLGMPIPPEQCTTASEAAPSRWGRLARRMLR
jgi:hypothetical protein